ncbi:MAG TPA: hypothetical protein DHV77_05030, partial [Erysipelotrichaceae bacterium]|nr:hypothetical protein [Erysipelotrichaceae bacterium]
MKMLMQTANSIATGGLIGKLSNMGSKGRLLASAFFMGTGASGMVMSGSSFIDNFMGLVDSISNGDDLFTIFHYASGTVCDAAGMYYGAKSFAGGTVGASAAISEMKAEWKYSHRGNVVSDSVIENITYEGNTGPICYGDNSSGYCFIAGTIVKTPYGDKNIEDVEAGDVVYACNVETGEVEEKEVVRTFINDAYTLIYITIGGEEICSTLNHPFYVVGKGFVSAGTLSIGDKESLVDGS